ncbi:MAG: thioredoxin [Stenomitos rutilans HA7619-LM2]|nr:thioredoxin [Stenomitos rutilans HA7619-LM2]
MSCITLTNDNFQAEVLNAKIPVLVDCWASWCGSLQPANPVLIELAIEFAGQMKLGRLDLATAENLATRYSIRAVPTLLLFQDGQVQERSIGSVSKQKLKSKLSVLCSVRHENRGLVGCL